jgi:hypothetical protein
MFVRHTQNYYQKEIMHRKHLIGLVCLFHDDFLLNFFAILSHHKYQSIHPHSYILIMIFIIRFNQ